MSDVVQMPENIGKGDRQRLESFGGHTIAHGRATRWHWLTSEQGGDVYKGGAKEELAFCISRDRQRGEFVAHDGREREVVAGDLERVMAASTVCWQLTMGRIPHDEICDRKVRRSIRCAF